MIHLSCQEEYYSYYGDDGDNNNNNSDTIDLLTKNLCPTSYFNHNIGKSLNITKYFGCGTYSLILILLLIYLKTTTK